MTHASVVHEGAIHDGMTNETSRATSSATMVHSGGSTASANATRSAAPSGASPSFVHGTAESNRAGSLIGGQQGAYYVTRPTSGRVAYDVSRSPESSGGVSNGGIDSRSARLL